VAGVWVAPAIAQSDTPLPSTVLRVAGHSRCSIDGGHQWKLLKAGDIIYAGSLVQTAQGSDLDLLLGGQVKAPAKNSTYNPDTLPGHFISLGADGVLKLEKVAQKSPSTDQEVLLELRTGTINGNVKKLAGGSRYEVAFAGGVAGMREAIYQLSSSGRLNVMKGKAFVAMTGGGEVKVVEAGNEFTPKVSPPSTAAAATAVSPAAVTQPVPPTITAAPAQSVSVEDKPTPPKQAAAPAQRPLLPRSGLRRAAP